MKINVIISADEKIREKIKYGFTILFCPYRVDVVFSRTLAPDCPNIFYGKQLPNDSKRVLWIRASDDFRRRVTSSTIPDVSGAASFDYQGKRLPRLFPIENPLNSEINFDVAAATFMLASEYQDLVSQERDEYDRMRATDSIQYKLGVLSFPVVNYYSRFLKEHTEKYFGINIESRKYGGAESGIALTHDVDFSTFLSFKMIRREVIGIALLNRHGLPARQRAAKLLFPLYALFGYDLPKIGLHFLRNTEQGMGVKSTFFVKTGATAKQDVSYNYRSRAMKDFYNSLQGEGFEIGIHPSMGTYVDSDQFVVEKKRLQETVGRRIESARQHYLRFTAGKTIGVWEKAGMKYDSTLGFSLETGFRNSVAFPYPLFNLEEDRISPVIELPLILMDGTLAENREIGNEQALSRMKELIRETRLAYGAASILFHNSIADPVDFPGYTDMYRELLREITAGGFLTGALSEIVENFR